MTCKGLTERYSTSIRRLFESHLIPSLQHLLYIKNSLRKPKPENPKLTNSTTTKPNESPQKSKQIRKWSPRNQNLALRPLTSCRPRPVVHRNDLPRPTRQLETICALSSPGHSSPSRKTNLLRQAARDPAIVILVGILFAILVAILLVILVAILLVILRSAHRGLARRAERWLTARAIAWPWWCTKTSP